MKLTEKEIMKTIELRKGEMRRFGVKKIGLFGSYLKGKAKKTSDVDFLVVFDKPTFDKYMELKFMLEKMLHKKVDLVIEDNLKPSLCYVKQEAKYVGKI
ncbi:MAG: nucleotidyltransferase domain-containing protein [Candidatus Aenigmarchaeota archaeon]|nr:nucleotidyltransferase domain-containing protein [Candidatus Aenigmarchaeota archaeon]